MNGDALDDVPFKLHHKFLNSFVSLLGSHALFLLECNTVLALLCFILVISRTTLSRHWFYFCSVRIDLKGTRLLVMRASMVFAGRNSIS